MPSVTLKIDGMMCQMSCGTTVANALKGVEGVEKSEASFENCNAVAWFTDPVKVSTLIDAVEDIGFGAEFDKEATPANIILNVNGMRCQKNCASKVAKALSNVPNVIHAEASKAEATASIWSVGSVSVSELFATIESLGYIAELNEKYTLPNVMLHIEGMMCQMSCGTTVTNALKSVPGVSHAVASFEDGDAKIWGDNLAEAKLIEAVESMGFGASHKSVHPLSTIDAPSSSSHQKISKKTNNSKSDKLKQQRKEQAIKDEAARVATENALKATNIPVIKLQCSGISCAVCCGKIEKHLREMNGVKLVTVNPVTHVCSIGFHNKPANANSNTFTPKPPNAHDLIHEVVSLGYGAREIMGGSKGDSALDRLNSTEDLDEWRNLFLSSVAFTIPLFILQYFFLSQTEAVTIVGGITLKELLMFCIATPMQFRVGRKYYVAAYLGYQHGVVGMDFLVSLGVGGSYLNSCVILALQSADPMFDKPVMFETAGMLLSFVTLGKFLEKLATGHTTAALAKLAGMQPQQAIRVSLDKSGNPIMNATGETTVDASMLQLGDCIKVMPGGAIPVDGEVLRGESYVDESMISGEPLPVAKRPKDNVFGGTINQLSVIYVTASRVGEETALAQIVRLVEEAQTAKAPIQAFADRIASIFAPLIILIAAFTFVFWIFMISGKFANPQWFDGDGSMQHMSTSSELPGPFLFAFMSSIAVLVVACPCALGLATPTAVMVGTGVGAKHGVLIKGGDVLEAATKINCVIFDKTGTLTSGKLSLSDEVHLHESCASAAGMMGSQNVPLASLPLMLAASAEQASEHPIGKAIASTATSRGLSTLPLRSDAKSDVIVGAGVVAACEMANGKSLMIAVGNERLLKEKNISLPSNTRSKIKALEGQGKTVVLVAIVNTKSGSNGEGGQLLGALALTDQLKPSAKATVANLRRQGIEVWMVTGDAQAPALHAANQAGIDPKNVVSKALPEGKVLEVKKLQGQGKVVALIGDGINDSPALAQADIGIAIGAGTQVALEAANMVLIRDDLHMVCVALDLAQTVFFRIKLNYVWALGYNVFGVPTAAGLVMPLVHGFHLRPEIAAACMAFSSIAVVLSSLSLNLYKPPSGRDNWASENDLFGLKTAVSWAVDSMVNKGKGRYSRVSDHDDFDDMQADSIESGGYSNSSNGSTRSSSPGGYGTTIEEVSNPFIET